MTLDVQALAKALNQAGVDPRRYVLVPLLTEPWAWELRPEGSVWLVHGRHEWKVESGGIGPHYDAEGPLCTFSGEEQACEVFLREMTGPGEPFAAEKARFSAGLVRSWWEDEVRIALVEPSLAAERVVWRERWRRRELLGRELMTVGELDEALIQGGVVRARFQLQGIDEIVVPEHNFAVALGRDESGRWYWGRWDDYRPGLLWMEYRFETEGEVCRSLYESCTGPITTTAPLTLAQWGHQKSVLLDNRAAAARYDQELGNHRPRPEH